MTAKTKVCTHENAVPAARGGILYPPRFKTTFLRVGVGNKTRAKVTKLVKVWCPDCGKTEWKEEK